MSQSLRCLRTLGTGLWLLLFLLMVPAAMGQHYTFSSYGIASGLSNLNVTTMAQDTGGIVWVGTQNGVFIADGSRFSKVVAFDRAGMIYIRAVHADDAGRVWVMDAHHLAYWEHGSVYPIANFNPNIYNVSGVDLVNVPGERDAIYVLKDGDLLRVATPDHGQSWRVSAAFAPGFLSKHPELSQLSSAITNGSSLWLGCGIEICNVDLKKERVRSFGKGNGLPEDRWMNLLLTRSGAIWARGLHSLVMLPAGADRFTTTVNAPKAADLTVPVPFTSIVEDAAGNVLLNLTDGVARRAGKIWQMFRVKNGIPQAEIDVLMLDRSGGLWMAPAGHGISLFRGYGKWEGFTKQEGLGSDVVWALPRDQAGNVWVATEAGLDRLEARTGRIYPQQRYYPFRGVIAAAIDARQHVWTGDSTGHVVDFDPATGHGRLAAGHLDVANQILVDRERRVWICSKTGLYYFSPDDNWSAIHAVPSLPKGVAYAISEAANGVLWVTEKTGVYRLEHGTWTVVQMPLKGEQALYYLMLAAAPDGTLWVQGTLPSAILHLRVVGDVAVVMDRVDDSIVESENIVFMRFDRRGWLWVGSDHGVQVFDGVRWMRCTAEDGLVWDDTDTAAFFADPDGSIWIGTSGGVSHLLHPEQVFNEKPPRVDLADVHLGENQLQEGVQRSFDLRKPLLSAHLFSTNYNRGGAIVYRYRLAGQENDWQESESANLRFAVLGPGNYTLSVVAFDRRLRLSSDVHSISFTLLEPWWNRTWFRLIEFLCAAAILIALWRLNIRLLIMRQRELESLVASRTRELERDKIELLSTRAALIEMAHHDGLTGLLNRRAIFERMGTLCEEALSSGTRLAIVMVDIDYFKRINDKYGHVAGDAAIRSCARRISQTIRPDDFVGRYGGEELLILLPGLDPASASTRLEELRSAIADEPIHHGDLTMRITCSFGVTWTGEEPCALEALVDLADEALYMAKKNGRNRVEFSVGVATAISLTTSS